MPSLRARLRAPALGLLAAAAFALHAPLAGAQAAASPPPVADFFREVRMSSPVLSPDGKKAAIIVFGEEHRGRLAVFDVAKPDEARMIAGFDKLDVSTVRWVNNERLVYSARDTLRSRVWGMAPGLWAIDADGGAKRQLAYVDDDKIPSTGTNVDPRILDWNWLFHSTLSDGSDDVLVYRISFDNTGDRRASTGLARLNTRNGSFRSLLKNPPADASYWWTDAKGTPMVTISESGALAAFHLAQPDGSWKKTFETNAWTDYVPVPLTLDKAGRLWMVGADPARKTDAKVLMRYDIQDPAARPQVALDLKGYDFSGSLIIERASREVLGVRYESDAPGVHWFNDRMKAIQADIDAQLSSTGNQIVCQRCVDAEDLLVVASSDRQPDVLLRYQPATRKLTMLAASRPWITAKQMAEREPFMVKTRDGLRMPVMVTIPAGPRKARPAVVLVHGGPFMRGTHWEWSSHAQFLASRGYVVIEPEFRGSEGYGYRHLSAGFKQWGLKMQDDVTDAGDWAVAQGFIDPKRVCIAGASYGGYATLMGLARYGDRYQCGINWVGVTDLNLMYTSVLADASEVYRRYGMPQLLGDKVKDAQQLRDTSPVNLAASIKRPLLMGYGGQDRRVPLEHGQSMRDALAKGGNSEVEWVVYPSEGHSWGRLESHVDFWTRAEKFLDRHIGAGAAR